MGEGVCICAKECNIFFLNINMSGVKLNVSISTSSFNINLVRKRSLNAPGHFHKLSNREV